MLPHEPNDGCEADAAAYRTPTCQALEQSNISITTVGSRTSGPASSPAAWLAHEGHPGWRIDELAAIAPQWALLKPDLISMLQVLVLEAQRQIRLLQRTAFAHDPSL